MAAPAIHDGAVRRARSGWPGELVLCVPEREADRDQPLLGAVVQVAFQAPPLLVGDEPEFVCRGAGALRRSRHDERR
jgi:hypothetical protein